MARRQLPRSFQVVGIDAIGKPLSATKLLATSFIIQSPISNTDFVVVGNGLETFFEIAPGKDLEVHGDNLDNGTSGYLDLNEWFVKAVGGVQKVNILYLERF